MEPKLRTHLISLADAFMAASGLQATTLSQRAAGDWRFFAKLKAGGRFTVRKYDEVVVWFAHNWPEGTEWPSDVPRPAPRPWPPAERAA